MFSIQSFLSGCKEYFHIPMESSNATDCLVSTLVFSKKYGMIYSAMYNYQCIRSRRRTLSLEITRDCTVLVRAPMRISNAAVDAFVSAHEDWISTHLESQRRRKEAAPPPPTAEEIAALKARAQAVLPQKVAEYAKKMGVAPQGVKITAARTRYGSCSASNSLCFSCFLMDCPEEAIDLVVAHELSHIRHKNHGPQFYQQLSGVFPDWKERKKLLHMR